MFDVRLIGNNLLNIYFFTFIVIVFEKSLLFLFYLFILLLRIKGIQSNGTILLVECKFAYLL